MAAAKLSDCRLMGICRAIIGTLPALAKESTLKKQTNYGGFVLVLGTMIIGFLFLYFMGDILGTIPANFFRICFGRRIDCIRCVGAWIKPI